MGYYGNRMEWHRSSSVAQLALHNSLACIVSSSMNKYYLLMRKMVFYTFRWLEASDWDTALVAKYHSMLAEHPFQYDAQRTSSQITYCACHVLRVQDGAVPKGIPLSLADTFGEEFDKAIEVPVNVAISALCVSIMTCNIFS